MGLLCIRALFIPYQPWNIIVPVASIILVWLLILGDAIRCARLAPPNYRLKAYNRWYVYFLVVVMAGIGGNLPLRFAQAFKIPTRTMEPTLVVGDRLLVDKSIFAAHRGPLWRLMPRRDPRLGDLVVFKLSLTGERSQRRQNLVKRVIGLPGDHIRIVHRQVFVNGQPLNEPYVLHEPAFVNELRPGDDFPPLDSEHILGATSSWHAEIGSAVKNGEIIVPSGKYFVLGDNREESWDSRFWGFVPRADILGKASVIYFSWDAKARRVRWHRIGEILK